MPQTSANSGGEQDEHGHFYETENVVCPAIFSCTEAEVQQYATMFQYPGQWPWSPVIDDQDYDVYPATLWGIPNPVLWILGMSDSGAITVDLINGGLTLTNQTEPNHIFHNGQAVRDYIEGADGSWTVTTTGTGTNVRPVVGPYIDWANEAVGPLVFDVVDTAMLIYITADQLPGFVIEEASSLLP